MNLDDALVEQIERQPGAWAVGTVTAVGAQLTVSVRGGSKNVARLASYTAPAIADVVLIACVPQSWCALGKIT